MTTCFNIAKYILEEKGQMSAMKLQKLVYYCQAWILAWDEIPLFNEHIVRNVNVLDHLQSFSGETPCLNT